MNTSTVLLFTCLMLTVFAMLLSQWFFRVLAQQEHEALKLQTRQNEHLIQFLLDHVPPGPSMDKASALLVELHREMIALRARHQEQARGLFRRRYGAAFPQPRRPVLNRNAD